MPSRNIIKTYVKDGIYHVYNRGVEKRDIFLDAQDYRVFLNYLKVALTAPDSGKKKTFQVNATTFRGIPRPPKNFYGKIELLAYCLMPNHFHFLIRQRDTRTMKEFIQSIATRYAMYFNKKYKRVGSLLQGPYKAILVMEEAYLLHLSRYIHRNPTEHTQNLVNAYSSYGEYLGKRKTAWVKPDFLLSFFKKTTLPMLTSVTSYENFVESYKTDSESLLGYLTLED
ncbi:transposase [Candidatus Gottesmanbacteria bacterium]|nr:transposase [Candidatus Gottesmanbacteria bacterium]